MKSNLFTSCRNSAPAGLGRSGPLLWAVCAVGLLFFSGAWAWSVPEETERWLTNEIAQGRIADFGDVVGRADTNRTLDARWLQALLTNPHLSVTPAGIRISRAIITNAFDLQNARVPGDVKLLSCVFQREVLLTDSEFTRGLALDDSEFMAGVDFRRAKMSGNFTAHGARFFGRVHAQGMKVGGSFWLQEATFLSEARFGYTSVGEELNLERALFYEAEEEAEFYGVSVGGMFKFGEAVFHNPANFIQMSVKGNLSAARAEFLNTNDLSTDPLRQSHYNADFGSLDVAGFSFFTGVRFDGEVSFRNAKFARLYLDEVIWPTNLHRLNCVRLEWMNYASIQATTNFAHAESNRANSQWKQTQTETWDTLSPVLARLSPYSADVYASLENYFQREGAQGLARKVGYENGRQYRKKLLWNELHWNAEGGKALIGWLWNGLLQITVGHGHYPIGALFWGLGIVLLGCRIFRKENMQPVPGKPEAKIDGEPAQGFRRLVLWLRSKDQTYHAFWYSLDMFIPIVDIKANDNWMPQPSRRLAWHYLIIHRMLGVILVPIGLAAFSGIIK